MEEEASVAPNSSRLDLDSIAQRVDQAIADAQKLEGEARAKAMALKSAIEAFHKVGLTEIVKKLKADPRGKELLLELAQVPAVYALFSMHGLIRADLKTRVIRVIEMVRPYMQSHGGDVSFVDVRGKTVLVRLSGNCNGCSMSSVTLRNTVEESLREHVPEIEGVEVVPSDPGADELVQLEGNPSVPGAGWVEGPRVDELDSDRPNMFDAGEHNVLLVRSPDGWRAYRNACAHQGLPLDGGQIDQEAGTITCPWHGFQYETESGECLSAPQCQLEPFPLRIVDGRIWVRPES